MTLVFGLWPWEGQVSISQARLLEPVTWAYIWRATTHCKLTYCTSACLIINSPSHWGVSLSWSLPRDSSQTLAWPFHEDWSLRLGWRSIPPVFHVSVPPKCCAGRCSPDACLASSSSCGPTAAWAGEMLKRFDPHVRCLSDGFVSSLGKTIILRNYLWQAVLEWFSFWWIALGAPVRGFSCPGRRLHALLCSSSPCTSPTGNFTGQGYSHSGHSHNHLKTGRSLDHGSQLNDQPPPVAYRFAPWTRAPARSRPSVTVVSSSSLLRSSIFPLFLSLMPHLQQFTVTTSKLPSTVWFLVASPSLAGRTCHLGITMGTYGLLKFSTYKWA